MVLSWTVGATKAAPYPCQRTKTRARTLAKLEREARHTEAKVMPLERIAAPQKAARTLEKNMHLWKNLL